MSGYSEPLGDTFQYNAEYQRLAEHLGVDKYERDDYGIASKLSIIRDWAGIAGKSDTPEEALATINGLRKKVGTTHLGRPLVDELYRHIRLDMDRRAAKTAAPKPRVQPKDPPKPEGKDDGLSALVKQAMEDRNLIKMTVKTVVQAQLAKKVESVVREAIK